jgi:hypothetical protein
VDQSVSADRDDVDAGVVVSPAENVLPPIERDRTASDDAAAPSGLVARSNPD